jgi:hypothetical protein
MIAELRTSPKNARKPQARSLYLRDAILRIAEAYDRMSVRQLYYQLVARRVIEKTEQTYKRVCDATVQLRLSGELPYGKIADGHRTRRAVYQHGGLQAALDNAHDLYRRNYWLDQPVHVEVWCEKDALSGVIQPVCEAFGVTYVATRGFPSLTLLYESAMSLVNIAKPAAVIFYFGDHNASGRAISATLEEQLRGHGAAARVRRIALNPDLIEAYFLPTRPGKWTDSRHANFAAKYGDACVELDSLPPDVLTDLVEEQIVSMIDLSAWRRAQEIEEMERETFASITAIGWEPGATYHLPGSAEATGGAS